MILGSDALQRALLEGRLELSPFDGRVEPASIDLRLGDDYLVPKPNSETFWREEIFDREGMKPCADVTAPIEYERITGPSLLIPALGFRLARTVERVRLDKSLTAFVEGRSSVGRAGLFIQNAGWVDPGFDGTITLELFNALPCPILLPAGIRICQLVVADADGAVPYLGKYQGQALTRGSDLWKDCARGL